MDTSIDRRPSWLPIVLAIIVAAAVLSALALPAGSIGVIVICLAVAVLLSATVPGYPRAKLIALTLLGLLAVIGVITAIAT